MCDRAVPTAPAATVLFLLLLFLSSSTVPAQDDLPETVGFADPAKVGSLYDYRLPDWGYRTNSMALDALGRGQYADADETAFSAETELHSFGYRESESRIQTAWVRFGGAFDHLRRDGPGEEEEEDRTSYSADLSTEVEQLDYFGPKVAFLAEFGLQAGFRETRVDGDSHGAVTRDASAFLGLGLAFGRMREVTPVVRAERLSERLVALGRRPLARSEVLRLARQLAQRSGYESVYRREDKYFWPPLLEEISSSRPFSSLEVLYLTEVLEESLVRRREGLRLDLVARASHFFDEHDEDVTEFRPTVALEWSRNLDLHHQFSAGVSGTLHRRGNGASDFAEAEEWIGRASLRYDWLIADRFTWTHEVSAAYSHAEYRPRARYWGQVFYEQESETTRWEFTSIADYFVVDQWSLRPSLRVQGRSSRLEDSREPEVLESEPWSWSARVALVYTSNRILR